MLKAIFAFAKFILGYAKQPKTKLFLGETTAGKWKVGEVTL